MTEFTSSAAGGATEPYGLTGEAAGLRLHTSSKGVIMNRITERLYLAYSMLVGRMEDREKGASMTEYAILVALMAALVVLLVGILGDKISTFIDGISIGS